VADRNSRTRAELERKSQVEETWLGKALAELGTPSEAIPNLLRGSGRNLAALLDQAKAVIAPGSRQIEGALGIPSLEQMLDQHLGRGESLSEKAGEFIGPPLTKAAKLADMAAAAGPVLGGILRPGGVKGLIPSHAMRLPAYPEQVKNIPREFTSPSIAITKGHLNPHFEDQNALTAQFIPKQGAFDPAAYPSTLFNRDAYTPRANQYLSGKERMPADGLEWLAERRLHDRGLAPRPGFPNWAERRASAHGEGKHFPVDDGGISGSHMLSIDASPHFRSFKEYENSKRGAKLLTGTPDNSAPYDVGYQLNHHMARLRADFKQGPLSDAVKRLMDSPGEGTGRFAEIARLQDTAKLSDKQFLEQMAQGHFGDDLSDRAMWLMKELRKVPSSYAELKVHGPVQMSPEHWAGVVLRPGREWNRYASSGDKSGIRDAYKEAVEDRFGLRAIATDGNPFDAADIAEWLQMTASPARRGPL